LLMSSPILRACKVGGDAGDDGKASRAHDGPPNAVSAPVILLLVVTVWRPMLVKCGPQYRFAPRPLFQAQVHAGVSLLRARYVPNRDGTRFLMHRRSHDVAPTTITVVLNATALKR
jgi:hypothetical protein